MRVARVHIENFRGIRQADLRFAETTVLLGDNNTGKSTVFEAIELEGDALVLAGQRHQRPLDHLLVATPTEGTSSRGNPASTPLEAFLPGVTDA